VGEDAFVRGRVVLCLLREVAWGLVWGAVRAGGVDVGVGGGGAAAGGGGGFSTFRGAAGDGAERVGVEVWRVDEDDYFGCLCIKVFW